LLKIDLKEGYIENKIISMIQKIKNNYQVIFLCLFFLFFLKQCGISRDIDRIKKENSNISAKMDSLVSKKDLLIEGLKTEKRMIQSTDRKMIDVNRQASIDQEIQKLESK
jgi:hypothetical protein